MSDTMTLAGMRCRLDTLGTDPERVLGNGVGDSATAALGDGTLPGSSDSNAVFPFKMPFRIVCGPPVVVCRRGGPLGCDAELGEPAPVPTVDCDSHSLRMSCKDPTTDLLREPATTHPTRQPRAVHHQPVPVCTYCSAQPSWRGPGPRR